MVVEELESYYFDIQNLVYNSVLDEAAGAPLVPQFLRDHVFTASRSIMDRMKGDVMGVLTDAWTQGVGTRDAAAMLRERFDTISRVESERIARTEINSAQSEVRQAKMNAGGVAYIQWWTAQDSRVRDSHRAQHGMITTIQGRYPNGLRYPHDRTGPLKEWINCRCRSLPFLMPILKAPPPGKTAFFPEDLVIVGG
jgi:SPP1 gp7 family putative phage head morphogenesis protein